MRPLVRCFLVTLFSTGLGVTTLPAQQPRVELYQARVVTTAGNRFRGTLDQATDTYLYLGSRRDGRQNEQIPMEFIRKVIIRRVNKKNAIITGAVIGGLLSGYWANESLRKTQTSNVLSYGLNLTFAAAGGAAAGLALGSAIGGLTSRVIRPLDRTNPGLSLLRQVEPFTTRYQENFINRLPKNNP